MFKTGLVSVSFRDYSVDEIITAVKKAGLSAVEWGSDVHAPFEDTEKLKYVAQHSKEAGIDCCSYGTYYRIGKNTPDEVLPYINAAKILGTDTLRVWCGDKGSAEFSIPEKEKLFEDCRKTAELAENNNVKLCLECHHHTFTDNTESIISLMENVNCESFKMYWQPNQYKSNDYNISLAKALSKYTENIHVFYWQGENKFPLENGKDIWNKYLKCFSGNHYVLLEFMHDGKIESLTKETYTLNNIITEGNL